MNKKGKFYGLRTGPISTRPRFAVVGERFRYAEFNTCRECEEFVKNAGWICADARIIENKDAGRVIIRRKQ